MWDTKERGVKGDSWGFGLRMKLPFIKMEKDWYGSAFVDGKVRNLV